MPRTRLLETTGPLRRPNLITAAKLLRKGKLVAFPTETVYGLGANAFNEASVKNIFRAKGRPQDNPLIVHIWSLDQLWMLAESLPLMFWVLAEHFMPGPLTLVVKRSKHVPSIVSAGLPSIAIRMPDHPVARAFLKESAVPVVAPSANISGGPSPTKASHVKDDLNGKISVILDGGACKIGVESTVLDLTKNIPVLLRPGSISREEIEQVLQMKIRVAKPSRKRPASPGMKYKHYSPKASVILFEGDLGDVVRAMKKVVDAKTRQGFSVGVMAEEPAVKSFKKAGTFSLGREGAKSAAKKLYDGFRTLDDLGMDVILCQGFEECAIGTALMNRIRKAASKRIRV